MLGDLPPNSSVTRFIVSAPSRDSGPTPAFSQRGFLKPFFCTQKCVSRHLYDHLGEIVSSAVLFHHDSRQLVFTCGDGFMKAAQNGAAFFLRRHRESRKRTLCGGNSASSIFLVGQRDSSDDLTVSRTDSVHDLSAMRINELSINVVFCKRFHEASPVLTITLPSQILICRNRCVQYIFTIKLISIRYRCWNSGISHLSKIRFGKK